MSKNRILLRLKSFSSKKRAQVNSWFFKTGPGQYGEGDVFWGISVPQIRRVVKEFNDLPLAEILELMKHEVHEVRLLAVLLLVNYYKKEPDTVFKAYLRNAKLINNWDLVDSSAPYIMGPYLEIKPRKILYELASSENIWERRIAMMSTFYFIKRGDADDALKIAEILINDKHDLIQKAVGWMLREIGKKCTREIEEKFLENHAATMPRTALRYAIEHFPANKRLYYLKLKNKNQKKV